MKEALQRAMAAKLADTKTPAPAKAVAPAKATPAKPIKHWASRDYPAPVPAAKTPTKAKTRHVVSIPGRASYEK